jgi:cellulose biosynthesis protein BcsS
MAHQGADRESGAAMSGASEDRRPHRVSGLGVLAVLAASILAMRPAAAGPLEVLAGWEGDTHSQGYGFVAVGGLFPAGTGVEVPLRLTASYLYYTFTDAGTDVSVRSTGASLVTGVRGSGPHGSVTFLVGGEARREHRDPGTVETAPGPPPAPAAQPATDETIYGVVGQVDGDLTMGKRWRGFLLANYAGAASYIYGRAAVRYQATNVDWTKPTAFFLGLEAVRQGNDESDALQGGGFMELAFVPNHVSLGFHAGYKESWSPGEDHRRGAYLGLGVYRRF